MFRLKEEVMIECDSGLGTGGVTKIVKIDINYNKKTGKPYKMFITEEGQGFDKDGHPLNPPWAYKMIKL